MVSDIDFTNGLQFEDITNLKNVNGFCMKLIETDFPKDIYMKHRSIHYTSRKNDKNSIDSLFRKIYFFLKKKQNTSVGPISRKTFCKICFI